MLDSFEEIEKEVNEITSCPNCGSRLKIISSNKGLFLGCSTFPGCKYIVPLPFKSNVTTEKILEGVKCPKCEGILAVKNGRYGMFIGCTNYPNCDFVHKDTKEKINCPICKKGDLIVKKNRYNKQYWGCSNYPNCTFSCFSKIKKLKCENCSYPYMSEKKYSKNIVRECLNCKCKVLIQK